MKIEYTVLKNLVDSKLSIRKIAKELNVCQQTVVNALKHYQLKTIFEFAHPNLDVDYFQQINTKEKAYWLGFLYADGSVKYATGYTKGAMTLVLELAKKDENQLDHFCEAINANKLKKRYYTRLNKYYSVSISITGQFVNHLFNQGCIPNKTFRINHPNFNNLELDLAFLLGFYDGDGTALGRISCGNYHFLQEIAKKYKIENHLKRRKRVWELYIPVSLKKQLFLNYEKSMERKRKFSNHNSFFEKNGYKYERKEKILWPKQEELKKLVWRHPLIKLANILHVSPNGIKKKCQRENIKLPNQGYWQKNKMVEPSEIESPEQECLQHPPVTIPDSIK